MAGHRLRTHSTASRHFSGYVASTLAVKGCSNTGLFAKSSLLEQSGRLWDIQELLLQKTRLLEGGDRFACFVLIPWSSKQGKRWKHSPIAAEFTPFPRPANLAQDRRKWFLGSQWKPMLSRFRCQIFFFYQAGCSQYFPISKSCTKTWVSHHWVYANCLASPWFSVHHLAMIAALLGAIHDKQSSSVDCCLGYAWFKHVRLVLCAKTKPN